MTPDQEGERPCRCGEPMGYQAEFVPREELRVAAGSFDASRNQLGPQVLASLPH
jgi:hypothetical protein